MTRTTTLTVAFLAFAGLAGGTALAKDDSGRHQRGDGPDKRFERADTDASGDITLEEFSAAFQSRLGNADANGDGKITVEEIAEEIQRRRAERSARRIVERFDIDGDGILAMEEIESRQKKMFALLDRNDDGKLERSEMRKGKGRHGKRQHRRYQD